MKINTNLEQVAIQTTSGVRKLCPMTPRTKKNYLSYLERSQNTSGVLQDQEVTVEASAPPMEKHHKNLMVSEHLTIKPRNEFEEVLWRTPVYKGDYMIVKCNRAVVTRQYRQLLVGWQVAVTTINEYGERQVRVGERYSRNSVMHRVTPEDWKNHFEPLNIDTVKDNWKIVQVENIEADDSIVVRGCMISSSPNPNGQGNYKTHGIVTKSLYLLPHEHRMSRRTIHFKKRGTSGSGQV